MKNKKNIEIDPEDLIMLSNEYKFIRQNLRIPQSDILVQGRYKSRNTISEYEKLLYIPPYLAYDMLTGVYAPVPVIQVLRNEWKKLQEQREKMEKIKIEEQIEQEKRKLLRKEKRKAINN